MLNTPENSDQYFRDIEAAQLGQTGYVSRNERMKRYANEQIGTLLQIFVCLISLAVEVPLVALYCLIRGSRIR